MLGIPQKLKNGIFVEFFFNLGGHPSAMAEWLDVTIPLQPHCFSRPAIFYFVLSGAEGLSFLMVGFDPH